MISVDQALNLLLGLVQPVACEPCTLPHAAGRVLRKPVKADRAQPPFAASAMDGYAVANSDEPALGTGWQVVGESAAGHGFIAPLGPGQAVRIFTGAPVPENATRIIIQENVTTGGDGQITLTDTPGPSTHIRAMGCDFAAGFTLPAPAVLGPSEIALLAAMNAPVVAVSKRPVVAIISTGDELVHPGETPKDDQIFASNIYGLKSMFDMAGATARLLPTARDNMASITTAFDLAQDADVIVTVGGASVGDHDLIGTALDQMGFEKAFYKIKMRPGKPLMAGKRGAQIVVGLPGNPVSALVCGRVFVVPMLRAMLGLSFNGLGCITAELAADIPANGPREHFMRGVMNAGKVTVFDRQDSALLSVLHQANVLVRRPPDDPARTAGHDMQVLPL